MGDSQQHNHSHYGWIEVGKLIVNDNKPLNELVELQSMRAESYYAQRSDNIKISRFVK